MQSDITSALSDALSNVQAGITADTSDAQAAIADLQQPLDVPVAVDTSDAQGALDALDAEELVVTVDADTAPAEAAIGELDPGTIETKVSADTGEAQSSLGALAGSASAARVGMEGTAAAGGLLSKALPIVGIAGFGAAVGSFVQEAIAAETAGRRFNATFGESAGIVERVDVQGLNTNLSDLALTLGDDDDAIRDALASFGNLGRAAGATQQEVAGSSKELLVLASRLKAANPNLGETDAILSKLTTGLARGGRALSAFNLQNITTAQIVAEATLETGKAADQITAYDKAVAGATLANEALNRSGGSAAAAIAEGASSSQLAMERLTQTLDEAKEAAGKDLLGPVIDGLDALLPAGVATIGIVGDVAAGFATLLVPVINLVAPGLETIADVLGILPGPILAVGVGVTALAVRFELLQLSLGGVGLALAAVAAAATVFQSFFGDSGPSAAQQDRIESVEALTSALEEASGTARSVGDVITESLEEAADAGDKVVTALGGIDIAKSLQLAGISAEGFADAVVRGGPAVDTLTAGLAASSREGKVAAVALQELALRENLAASARLQSIERSSDYNQAQQEAAHAARIAADGTGDYAAALDQVTPKIDNLGTASSGASLTTEQLDQAVKDTSASLDKANSALDDAISKLERFLGLPIDAEEANIRFQASLDKLTKSLQENGLQLDATGTNFDLTEEKGRAVASAFDELGQQAISSSVDVLNQGGSVQEATDKFDLLTAAIAQQALESGLSKDQVDALLVSLGLTRADFVAKVAESGTEEAKAKVADLNKQLTDLDGKVVTTQVLTVFRSVDDQGRVVRTLSKGGPVFPDVKVTVGEDRPELFIGASGRAELVGVFGQETRSFAEAGYIIPRVAALPRSLSPTAAPTAALEAVGGLAALMGTGGGGVGVQVPTAVQVTAPVAGLGFDSKLVDALHALASREFGGTDNSMGDLIVHAPPTSNPELWALSLLDAIKRRR